MLRENNIKIDNTPDVTLNRNQAIIIPQSLIEYDRHLGKNEVFRKWLCEKLTKGDGPK